MYRLGEREHSHRSLYISLSIVLVLCLGAYIAARHFLTADTSLGPEPAASITNISYDQPQVQTADVPYFTMNIPKGWQLKKQTGEAPTPTYVWQGTSAEDRNRWISVYVDMNLPSFAVNRELHIQGEGHGITVVSEVSDNCTSFTGVANQGRGSTPAKWEGIDFMCDAGNYERDVVGIVSPNGLNNVVINGNKGPHNYFFTYTDNSSQPNYSIFTAALRSFQAK